MLEHMQPPTCEKCARGIVFVRHERTQRLAPIDAVPTPGGNCLIDPTNMTYKIIPPQEQAQYPGQLHKPHWATCPYAAEFRRG